MNKAIQLPDAGEFCRWQSPRRLLDMCDLVSKEVSDQGFFTDGEEFEKTVQEAIVAANFALRCDALITPVPEIRMTQQNTEGLDFELKSNTIHQFEITTAYDEECRIREDYRDGKGPIVDLRSVLRNPNGWRPSFVRKQTKVKG